MGSELNPGLVSFAQPPSGSIEKSADASLRSKENTFAGVYKSLNLEQISARSLTSMQHHDSSYLSSNDQRKAIRREGFDESYSARKTSDRDSAADRVAIAAAHRNSEERQDVASLHKRDHQSTVHSTRDRTELTANKSQVTADEAKNAGHERALSDQSNESQSAEGSDSGNSVSGNSPSAKTSQTNGFAQDPSSNSSIGDPSYARQAAGSTAPRIGALPAGAAFLDGESPAADPIPSGTASHSANQLLAKDDWVVARLGIASIVESTAPNAVVGETSSAQSKSNQPVDGLLAAATLLQRVGSAAQPSLDGSGGQSLAPPLGQAGAIGEVTRIEGDSSKTALPVGFAGQVTSQSFLSTNNLSVDPQLNAELSGKLPDSVIPLALQASKPQDLLIASEQKPLVEGQAASAAGLLGLFNSGLAGVGTLKNRDTASLSIAIPAAVIGAVDDAPSAVSATTTRQLGEAVSAASSSAPVTRLVAQSPLVSGQWPTEVAEHVRMLINRGLQSAELQLSPQNLGLLQVRVETVEDQARVFFNVQTAGTKEQIDAQLPRLRELFMSSNVELVDVDVNAQGRESGDSAARNSEQLSISQGAKPDMQSDDILIDSNENWSHSELSTGLLDTFA